MGANERRTAIWHTLCIHRHVTINFLASRCGVSPRTIRYDVEVLSRSYPIETRPGKNGGVRVADWFHPGEGILTPEQMDLLLKLYCEMDGNEAMIMSDIIALLGQKG